MDASERKSLRKQLWKLLFWRGLVLGLVACLIFWILFVVLVLLSRSFLHEHLFLCIGMPVVCALAFYIYFNLKTGKVVLDLMRGKKRKVYKVVTDLIHNNHPMSGPYMTWTIGRKGGYYYVFTHDGFFYGVGEELSKKMQVGDAIIIHEALKSLAVFKLERVE